jgi:hypothetical protein
MAPLAKLDEVLSDIIDDILLTLTDQQANRGSNPLNTVQSYFVYMGVDDRKRCFSAAEKFGKLCSAGEKLVRGVIFRFGLIMTVKKILKVSELGEHMLVKDIHLPGGV